MRYYIGGFVLHEVARLTEHRRLVMSERLGRRRLLLLLRRYGRRLSILLRRRGSLGRGPRRGFARVSRCRDALTLRSHVAVVITRLAVVVVALLLLSLARPLTEQVFLMITKMDLQTLVTLKIESTVLAVVLSASAAAHVLLLVLLLIDTCHFTHYLVSLSACLVFT